MEVGGVAGAAASGFMLTAAVASLFSALAALFSALVALFSALAALFSVLAALFSALAALLAALAAAAAAGAPFTFCLAVMEFQQIVLAFSANNNKHITTDSYMVNTLEIYQIKSVWY